MGWIARAEWAERRVGRRVGRVGGVARGRVGAFDQG
jgi:hypothetical protein